MIAAKTNGLEERAQRMMQLAETLIGRKWRRFLTCR